MFRRGSIYWTVIGGVRTSLRTGDKADAEALEARLKHERYQEAYLGRKPKRTWGEARLRWGKEKSHKVTWHDDLRTIRWWSQFFQDDRDIRTITREEVDGIFEGSITSEASSGNSTANHKIAYLAAILNAAARKWDWIDKAPLLRRYPNPSGRARWLLLGEWLSLKAALPSYLQAPATFSLATGMRRGKVVALRWQEVDLGKRSVAFIGNANKLGNTIPLNDTAMKVLEEIQSSPVRHMQLVFTRDGRRLGHYQKEWYRALEKCGLRRIAAAQENKAGTASNGAGFKATDSGAGTTAYDSTSRGLPNNPASAAPEDVCWHTLRHTWASWLAQAGVPENVRKRLGGWSSREVVDRYSHLDLESLRGYAAVIDDVLRGKYEPGRRTEVAISPAR